MFPENYPTLLKTVSYDIKENYGIYARWNTHTKTTKDNPYFVQNMLKAYLFNTSFKDRQTIPVEVFDLIKYIADCFQVKWTEDEFVIKPKSKEVNGKYKRVLSENKFYELAAKATITEKKHANRFLKDCLTYLKNEYNNIVLKSFQNSLKNS